MDQVASKEDVQKVRTELAERELEIVDRIARVADSVSDVRQNVAEVKVNQSNDKADVYKWLIPIIFGHSVAMAGIVAAVSYWFTK